MKKIQKFSKLLKNQRKILETLKARYKESKNKADKQMVDSCTEQINELQTDYKDAQNEYKRADKGSAKAAKSSTQPQVNQNIYNELHSMLMEH